jgi:nucleoside-triphosphatase THEP1
LISVRRQRGIVASVVGIGSLAIIIGLQDMFIIITGEVGIGKGTVCRKALGLLPDANCQCGGVITRKDGDGKIIAEDVLTQTRMTLASRNGDYQGPSVGAYHFNPAGLAFGMDALNKGAALPLFVVDEIGPLEVSGRGFANAVTLINGRKSGSCLAVIRVDSLHSFLPRFDELPLIYLVTSENRNDIPLEISQLLDRSFAIAQRQLVAPAGQFSTN